MEEVKPDCVAAFEPIEGGKRLSSSASSRSPFHHLSVTGTPPLDGTILPGLTRASMLSLLSHTPMAHISAVPQLPANNRLHTAEHPLTMSEVPSPSGPVDTSIVQGIVAQFIFIVILLFL